MKLRLVKKQNKAKGTKSFFFDPNEKNIWKPGQYLYLTLGDITKQFTIASSPTEKYIQVTTRIRKESEFKQNLDSLEIGEEVEARSPFGSFIFPIINSSQLTLNCFLAGGIGITPFRSMIKYSIDKNFKKPIFLIYSNSDSDFVFKNELDKWQTENDFLKIYYHNSGESGHLNSDKIKEIFGTWNLKFEISSMMWVVGPSSFVNSMEDSLEQLDIKSDIIQSEKFIGY